MANPPPPYDEVVREHPPALVVRLQVWHYNISGRSNVYNDGLAQTFLDNDTELWKVVPLEVEGVTGPGSHDQFVPVEVISLFCHTASGEWISESKLSCCSDTCDQ